MAKIVLDTNAFSAFMGGDSDVLEELARASTVYLPVFVLGELHFGFLGGARHQENLVQLSRFLAKPTVQVWLPTGETGRIYGEIKDSLKRAGTPIPINDVWIASACIESGARLVTYDRHFVSVPGLRLWRPI